MPRQGSALKARSENNSVSASLLNLEVGWGRPRLFLGPAWAVVCGAVASPGWEWNGRAILTLFLSILLADGLLGSLWNQVSSLGSEKVAKKRGNPSPAPGRILLPYAQPGSWGQRLGEWVGERWRAWQASENPTQRKTLGLLIASLLALALGAFLGIVVFLLVAMSLLVAGMWLRLPEGGDKKLLLAAIYGGGLAWLVGYVALSGTIAVPLPVDLDTPGLRDLALAIFWAGVYFLVLYSFQKIAAGDLQRGPVVLAISQALAVVALILLKEPILVGIYGLLLIPQLLFLSMVSEHNSEIWYLERIQVFTMATMLIGAIALQSG